MEDLLKNIPILDIGTPQIRPPNPDGLKEYVVTLHNYEDLDTFYDDMETPGGDLYIPDRAVPVDKRRPISRNTHYRLSEEEATQLKNDPRVLDVALCAEDSGKVIRPCWNQTSTNFDKGTTVDNTMINWGLLRCVAGNTISNWGSDATSNASGTITTTSSGKNVDVVIFDGLINPTHPEYQKNPEGTGGTRVVEYNWFKHLPEVTGAAAGNYDYNQRALADTSEDHGTHVAGTACGNTQGWARDANIYNINPYGLNTDYLTAAGLIRAFHRNKPINPETGRKNPTVVNMSFGVEIFINMGTVVTAASGNVQKMRFLGNMYDTSPWSIIDWAYPATRTGAGTANVTISGTGIFLAGMTDGSYGLYFTNRSTDLEAEVQDMMNEGIICVGAAGNAFSHVENYSTSESSEYNDYIILGGAYYPETLYTKRGGISATPNCLCVGASSTEVDGRRASFTGYGPRVDIFSPGVNIMSAHAYGVVPDNRSGGFNLAKLGGTSMASPQVTGVVACILETYPHFKQTDIRNYLFSSSTPDMADYGDAYAYPSYTSLHGGPNRHLKYTNERNFTGEVFPKKNMLTRPTKGQTFPRPRIFTTK